LSESLCKRNERCAGWRLSQVVRTSTKRIHWVPTLLPTTTTLEGEFDGELVGEDDGTAGEETLAADDTGLELGEDV